MIYDVVFLTSLTEFTYSYNCISFVLNLYPRHFYSGGWSGYPPLANFIGKRHARACSCIWGITFHTCWFMQLMCGKSHDTWIYCSTFQCRNTNLNVLQEFWLAFAFFQMKLTKINFVIKTQKCSQGNTVIVVTRLLAGRFMVRIPE